MENSFSPMSLASPPVAAMLPAVSEASEVVSRFSVAPTEAMSWPFLSTRKTILALASRERRSQTPLICWNSSSYITICGCIRETSSGVGVAHADAERLDQLGDVERRRLSFHGGIGGDDHFFHSMMQARHQLLQLELIGADAVQR